MNDLILGLIVILCMMGDFIATKTGGGVALLIICVAILGHLFFKHKRDKWRKEFDERDIY